VTLYWCPFTYNWWPPSARHTIRRDVLHRRRSYASRNQNAEKVGILVTELLRLGTWEWKHWRWPVGNAGTVGGSCPVGHFEL